jgi:hypothetical protein
MFRVAALLCLLSTVRPAFAVEDGFIYEALKSLRGPLQHHGFAVDNTGAGGRTYTKPTNIGLDLLSTIAAVEKGDEGPSAAREHVRRVLNGLDALRVHHGHFPEYIHLERAGVRAEVKNGEIGYSSIDSAWLHFALSVLEAYYRSSDPALAARLDAFVRGADYRAFLRAGGTRLGFGFSVSALTDEITRQWPNIYDNKNSEARLLVVFLTAIGKIPPEVWSSMSYGFKEYHGLPVADGWKMSAFVEFAGNSYFDEERLAPKTLGVSHRNYLEVSRRLAERRGYVVAGWAPCYGPRDDYQEYGLDNPDVVSPYAAALFTTVDDPAARRNFADVLQFLPSSTTPEPFPDALDPRTGNVVNERALSLDQNLLYHALNKDVLRKLVARTDWYREACRLLRQMDDWHADR